MAGEQETGGNRSVGYHGGSVETVISVDEVNRQAAAIAAAGVKPETVAALAKGEPYLKIESLSAGYGKMEILHDFNLQVGRGQSLCLIGPNGAGKSTVLHSIFGFTNIFGGSIQVQGRDVTALSPKDKLRSAGVAYILQDKSVFPGMTVEENLWMGGYLMDKPAQAKAKAEEI
ncbi:MAG: ATP-binding cassette domain-containing protein, partial [Minwuiales bacterium]|nr:ATP-binding cassette domain-containing protein [Minwuiales bacterium]